MSRTFDEVSTVITQSSGRTGAAEAIRALSDQGLILLGGVADRADLLQITSSIAVVVPHRDSGPDGVTTIFDLGHTTVRSGFAGFSARALAPHTDRSGVVYPPALLAICCSQPAESGGECVLVDGQTVYDDLAANQPDALKSLFLPRSVQFGGAGGYLGSILSKGIADRIILRARFDDLAKFSPALNRWILQLSDTIDRHAITFTLRAGKATS